MNIFREMKEKRIARHVKEDTEYLKYILNDSIVSCNSSNIYFKIAPKNKITQININDYWIKSVQDGRFKVKGETNDINLARYVIDNNSMNELNIECQVITDENIIITDGYKELLININELAKIMNVWHFVGTELYINNFLVSTARKNDYIEVLSKLKLIDWLLIRLGERYALIKVDSKFKEYCKKRYNNIFSMEEYKEEYYGKVIKFEDMAVMNCKSKDSYMNTDIIKGEGIEN